LDQQRSRRPRPAAIAALLLLAGLVPAAAQDASIVPATGGPAKTDPTYGDFGQYRVTLEAVRAYFDTLDALTALPSDLHRQIGVEKGDGETIEGIVAELETSDPQVLDAIATHGLTLYDYAMLGNTVMDAYAAVRAHNANPRNVHPENVELVRANWKEIDARYKAVRQKIVQGAEERMARIKASRAAEPDPAEPVPLDKAE
jgi:hypothetical protein